MMKLLLGCLVAAALLSASLYTVDAREVVVVTQFGKPVETVIAPGLKVRAPWPLHQVIRYDSRVRLLSVPPSEVLTKESGGRGLRVVAYRRSREVLEGNVHPRSGRDPAE
jgi:membrane protease subunit HflC